MVDCLRDQPDPTGSSPGFQARLKPRLETRDSPAGSAGPADNQPWIPLFHVWSVLAVCISIW